MMQVRTILPMDASIDVICGADYSFVSRYCDRPLPRFHFINSEIFDFDQLIGTEIVGWLIEVIVPTTLGNDPMISID